MFSSYFTNGVFVDDSSSDHLRVEKAQGLTLTVKAGRANINGAFYWQKDDETITLEKNSATKSYNIILRLNDNDAHRNITLVASDINDGITRSDSIYDLVLATVTVTGNASEVKGSDITDTRLDSTRCGAVTSAIKSVQSLDLFTQVTELFKEIKAQNESEMNANRTEFNDWFETVKDTLDANTAGKLSNRISNIENMIKENHFTTILLTEDGALVDENGHEILADWKYKVDGGQDSNSDNIGDSGNGSDNAGDSSGISSELKKIKAEIIELEEGLVSNTKEDAKTKRSLSALWDLNKGISYRFETDSEKAYKKQIPSGSKLASINKVGGKTIVWNQMFNHEDIKSVTVEGITFTNNGDGTYTANGTSSGIAYISNMINIIKDHTYYIRSLTTIGSDSTYTAYITGSDGLLKTSIDYGSGAIVKALNNGNGYFVPLNVTKGVTVNDLKIVPQVYDLTKMFGSGNEPSTPEEFEAMLPNDYYPYNEGELMSMSVNDVIYTDTSSNQVSHPIPQSIQNLDGYGWSAGTAYNYVDFENKKYYKCVDRVDLGSLNYTKAENMVYSRIPNPKVYPNASTKQNVCCAKYLTTSYSEAVESGNEDKYIYIHNSMPWVCIRTNTYDANTFKVAMKDTYLYYELAKPIVTDISDIIGDTFQEPFEVESGGSLTFKNTNGDGYQIAVPSDIQYTVALSEVNA